MVEELALGSIRQRDVVLELVESLRRFPVLSHPELMTLVSDRRLWGQGLSAVDGHLLGAVALVKGARLWTRDRRLMAACRVACIAGLDEPS